MIGGALQFVFLAALAFGIARHPRISAAASLALPLVFVITLFIAKVGGTPALSRGAGREPRSLGEHG